jgi:aspartyl protease family protein
MNVLSANRGVVLFLALVVGSVAGGSTSAQTAKGADMDGVSSAMDRLQVGIPMSIAGRDPIRRHLEELGREPCDQQAIADLGKALDTAGYRREAANAHIRFSATCGGHAPSLRAAANVLLKLSDYAAVVTVTTELIKLEPYNDNGFYLRALAHNQSGSYQRAIDDYVTAIELFGNKDRISSVSYLGMARSYEKLGRFCDAVLPLQSWIALNPASNDTSQVQRMVSDYMAKGSCTLATGNEETFPVSRQRGAVTLPVVINGVRTVMVLDTGATFVSLKRSLAQKASVAVDQDSTVQLHTANGITEGKIGRASTIQLRSLQAKDVPVVVQDDAKATYGNGVDGLLGMSFLSRFKVTIDPHAIRITNRQPK